MIARKRDIARMPFEGRGQRLGSIIPYLDRLIVRSSSEIWLIRSRIIIHVIDPLHLMRLQHLIRPLGPQIPSLDRLIQTRQSKGIGILRIDRQTHCVMIMPLKNLHAFPFLFPVEHFDRYVVRGGQGKGLGKVDDEGPNVVGRGFERGDLSRRVVIVDAELKVVGIAGDPFLAGDEVSCPNRDVGELEGFDDSLEGVLQLGKSLGDCLALCSYLRLK